MGHLATDIDDILHALQYAAKRSEGGITAIANRLGKSPIYLANKLNPSDETHVPNIGEFIAVIMTSGDTSPLDALCEFFDGQFMSRTKAKMSSPMIAALAALAEGGDVARVIKEAMDDGKISDNEKARIKREIREAREALQIIDNSL